ncbi:PKD domain-containing protein partial sequence [Fusibacter sp. 3D3]|nr:PKD domain-containing protein partial sequence [Fusibacter sp. 3D3]
MYNTKYVFEGSNQIVELTNLSHLDAQIGGIEKIEPNKAYGKDGHLYTFKETPTILEGEETFTNGLNVPEGIQYVVKYSGYGYVTVIYPRQVTHSDFTYSRGEKWQNTINLRSIPFVYTSVDEIDASQTSSAPYLNLIPKVDKLKISSRYEYASIFTINSVSKSFWLSPTDQTLFDYKYLAYKEMYTYSHKTYNPWVNVDRDDDDGNDRSGPGYDYYFNVTIGSTVALKESPYQVGWKTYGIDASKIKTSTYRTGSSKYLLYLAKSDSFKKVSQDLEDFIKAHDIAVRVSTKASYVDDTSISATETNLRNLMTANPKGKQYSEHAIDAMLEDIIAENKIQIAPDGGTYVILGEDTITYDKFYRDLENDSKLSERSSALHDKDYFENTMGLSAYHNQVLAVPLTTFDKVGKFTIEY